MSTGLKAAIGDRLPPGTSPRLGVVLCHGFGAPGDDLLPIAEMALQISPELAAAAQFLVPEAPLSLDEYGAPEGRAWWMLNLARLQSQLSTRKFDEVRSECPAGLPAARIALTEAITTWHAETGLDWSRTVLAGFSQGAMVSVDVGLHAPQRPAGLAVLSGMPINEAEWRKLAAGYKNWPVFQSHGTYDPVLPYVVGTWLKELFEQAGCDLEFVSFEGAHQIPSLVLQRFVQFLVRRIP